MATTEECATGSAVRVGALDRDGLMVDRVVDRVVDRTGLLWRWTRGAETLTWAALYAARASDREIRETSREAPAADVLAAACLATAWNASCSKASLAPEAAEIEPVAVAVA